jgi:hypothetical protein
VLFLGLPLATGAALLVYLASGLSLRVGLVLTAGVGAAAAATAWVRLVEPARPLLRRRVLVGVASGAIATAGYDLVRLALWKGFDTSFQPFDIFGKFGTLLAGDGAAQGERLAVGVTYHYANGLGFGVAYVLLVARPSVWTGLLWAALLETLMVSLYPRGLGVTLSQEFVGISVVGHATYGTLLGLCARRGLE